MPWGDNQKERGAVMIIRDKDGSYRRPQVKGQFKPHASEEPDQDDQMSEAEGELLADDWEVEQGINHSPHVGEPGSAEGK
jgi:hypothetical protein